MSTRDLIQALRAMDLKREVIYLHVGQGATKAIFRASIVVAVGSRSASSTLPFATATRPAAATTASASGSAGCSLEPLDYLNT